jgi:hypothetical protein
MCDTVVLEGRRSEQSLAMLSRRGLVAGEKPVQGVVDRGGERQLCVSRGSGLRVANFCLWNWKPL